MADQQGGTPVVDALAAADAADDGVDDAADDGVDDGADDAPGADEPQEVRPEDPPATAQQPEPVERPEPSLQRAAQSPPPDRDDGAATGELPANDTAQPSPSPKVDALIGRRYRIRSVLGHGGMADVYLARDEVLGRQVAIKIFRPGADSAADRARFRAEVRTLAGLTHAHLVALYDGGKDDAHPWCVMQYLDGGTLAQLASPLSPLRAAQVGAQVAEALAYVHAVGIVHRDVKPSNVLLNRDGEAYLSDFGVAQIVDTTRLTASGALLGTAAYLSPEQVLGRPATRAVDVYALALVLLESLTGRREYPGAPVESAVARLSRQPQVPARLGLGWVRLLSEMTDLDPAARPDAATVARRLRDLAVALRRADDGRAAAGGVIPISPTGRAGQNTDDEDVDAEAAAITQTRWTPAATWFGSTRSRPGDGGHGPEPVDPPRSSIEPGGPPGLLQRRRREVLVTAAAALAVLALARLPVFAGVADEIIAGPEPARAAQRATTVVQDLEWLPGSRQNLSILNPSGPPQRGSSAVAPDGNPGQPGGRGTGWGARRQAPPAGGPRPTGTMPSVRPTGAAGSPTPSRTSSPSGPATPKPTGSQPPKPTTSPPAPPPTSSPTQAPNPSLKPSATAVSTTPDAAASGDG